MGLSYAESWTLEWHTKFCDVTFPRVRLDPGESKPFEITIPVPPAARRSPTASCLHGYEDPDPDHDYLGLYITAGTQRHGPFIPFDE